MAQLPRRPKRIDGVSDAGSLVGLQAALYESEQRRRTGGSLDGPVERRAEKRDLFSKRNEGVEARDERVRLVEAAETAATEGALARKAARYEQLMRGDVAEPGDGGDSVIDWERKQLDGSCLVSDDMRRDAERRQWEADASRQISATQRAPEASNSAVKHFLSEVVAETEAGRAQLAASRSKRERERQTRAEMIAAKRQQAAAKRADAQR